MQKKTDHECATYSCKDPDDIHDLVNDLEGEKTFDCFHHPLKLDYVYIDTANLALLLFLFVCGLLLIIAGFIVLFFYSYICVLDLRCWIPLSRNIFQLNM